MLAVPRQLAERRRAIHNRVVVASDVYHDEGARQIHRSESHAGIRPRNDPREDRKEVESRGRVYRKSQGRGYNKIWGQQPRKIRVAPLGDRSRGDD